MSEEIVTGILDSGVGGLSVLKKLMDKGGSYIYFGDTKNLPYGSKTKDEIISFTRKIIDFFISKGAKKVIMACNTSSALAYDTLKREFEGKIKIYPLIQTIAPYIAKETCKIGIMATEGTVKSLKYTKEILKANPDAKVFELACPKLVPIVENGLYNNSESITCIENCIKILLDKGCKKIVLGCTHYPYLMPILTKFVPREIFIDPAEYMKNLIYSSQSPLKVEFYVSASPEIFRQNAKLFMEINDTVCLIENAVYANA